MEIDILGKPPTQKEIDAEIDRGRINKDRKWTKLVVGCSILFVFSLYYLVKNIERLTSADATLIDGVLMLLYGVSAAIMARGIESKSLSRETDWFPMIVATISFILIFSLALETEHKALIVIVVSLVLGVVSLICLEFTKPTFNAIYKSSDINLEKIDDSQYVNLAEHMEKKEVNEYCKKVGLMKRGLIRYEFNQLVSYSNEVDQKANAEKAKASVLGSEVG